MKSVLIALSVVVGLGLILLLTYMGSYNQLVSRQENVNDKWGQVQNDYQRRASLIPNLVNTVKGAANFEQQTLKAVVEARAKVGSVNVSREVLDNPEQFKKFEQAQGELSSALSRLLVVAEQYPQLKATESFMQLQAQLEGTENRIAVARRDFNVAVREYNTSVRTVPTNFVAGLSGFKERPYFEAEPGSEKTPEVKF